MNSSRLKNLDRACLVILALAALLGSAWVTAAVVTQKSRITQENEQLVRELRDLKQTDGALQALRQEVGRVRQELAGLNERIPSTADTGILLKQLDYWMRQRRIILASIEPQAAVPEALYEKTPIRMVFNGTFLQIYQFLHDLEAMGRLLIPEKMVITGAESSGRCQVDLTILIFERKAPGAGG